MAVAIVVQVKPYIGCVCEYKESLFPSFTRHNSCPRTVSSIVDHPHPFELDRDAMLFTAHGPLRSLSSKSKSPNLAQPLLIRVQTPDLKAWM